MTESERSTAVDHILAECHGNYSPVVVLHVLHRLGYTVGEIGSKYLSARLDEALAQQIFAEKAA